MQLQTEVRNKQMEKMKLAGAANKKEGDAFLAGTRPKKESLPCRAVSNTRY